MAIVRYMDVIEPGDSFYNLALHSFPPLILFLYELNSSGKGTVFCRSGNRHLLPVSGFVVVVGSLVT